MLLAMRNSALYLVGKWEYLHRPSRLHFKTYRPMYETETLIYVSEKSCDLCVHARVHSQEACVRLFVHVYEYFHVDSLVHES